jgi:hypothetical protein
VSTTEPEQLIDPFTQGVAEPFRDLDAVEDFQDVSSSEDVGRSR